MKFVIIRDIKDKSSGFLNYDFRVDVCFITTESHIFSDEDGEKYFEKLPYDLHYDAEVLLAELNDNKDVLSGFKILKRRINGVR